MNFSAFVPRRRPCGKGPKQPPARYRDTTEKQHATEFEKCRAQYGWPNDIALPVSPAPEDSSALPAWLAATAHLPGEWKKAEAVRYDKKQFVSTLRKAFKTWSDNTQSQKELDRLLPRLRRALEIVEKAGFVLEAALNFLTLLYECAVPRKPEDRYTIGDLLPAINKKLRQALRVEIYADSDENGKPIYKSVSLTPILDELTRIAEARNVFGCHFKVISFSLLDSDALGFGEQVLALMEALTDPDAGWPKSDKSGEYWANSGETRRLHPLRKPV